MRAALRRSWRSCLFDSAELSTCGPDRCVVVRICGECDASNATTLREFLLGLLTSESARMVLDLSGLDFLDCAGASTRELVG